MKLDDSVHEPPPPPPPPPPPLPVPRYDHLFTSQERKGMEYLLRDLADEIILIRSRMLHLFRASSQAPSPARLTCIVDLFSRAAVRLGRLILHRQKLVRQRLTDSETVAGHRLDEHEAYTRARQQLEALAAIRSSKNTSVDLIIENPLVLSPFQRRFIEPLLYPEDPATPARGRPSVDLYAVLEGILHKLLTGLPWYHLPLDYPSYTTCHRYYRIWLRNGLLDKLLLYLSISLFIKEKGQEEQEDPLRDILSGLDLDHLPPNKMTVT